MNVFTNDVITALVDVIKNERSATILLVALTTLNTVFNAFRTYSSSSNRREYDELITKFDQLEGIDRLEILQRHPNKNIYELSQEIIKNHFGVENETDVSQEQCTKLFEF